VRPEVRLRIGRIEGDLEDLRRVVERATRFVVDQAVPEGPHWHEELLPQASLEIPSLRPAVLRRSTRDCLDEYRRFRHVVRNVYAFVFDRARLRGPARGLPKCFEDVSRDLQAFREFLERLHLEISSSTQGEEQ